MFHVEEERATVLVVEEPERALEITVPNILQTDEDVIEHITTCEVEAEFRLIWFGTLALSMKFK